MSHIRLKRDRNRLQSDARSLRPDRARYETLSLSKSGGFTEINWASTLLAIQDDVSHRDHDKRAAAQGAEQITETVHRRRHAFLSDRTVIAQ